MRTLPTFKLVGDNLDKSVRPRDMRIDCQAQALRYFHMHSVFLLNLWTTHLTLTFPFLIKILTTTQDHEMNFAVLNARTFTKHMPFFKKFGSGLEHHLVHERYEEMSAKSEVVSAYITIESARIAVFDLLTHPKIQTKDDCQASVLFLLIL